MYWITKRYDQFFLVVSASALMVCAGLTVLRMQSFGTHFGSALTFLPKDDIVPVVSLEKIDAAKDKLENPPVWQGTKGNNFGNLERGSLFISEPYVVKDPSSTPEKLTLGSIYKDSLTGQAIPNAWFLQYGLPLRDPMVTMRDPDKDGFANEDEWRAKTNPIDKASHPPYISKLFLDKFVQTPFRLVLHSYDGDPKGPPEKLLFQLDTIDLRQPTEFLKLGDMVPKTNFKLQRFEFKQAPNAKIQGVVDTSELTLVNVDTGKKVVLVLDQVVNSPDEYAGFIYEWPIPHQKFLVRTGQDFVLRPEVDDQHRYQLIEVNESEAQIRLPSGEIQVIKPDPRREAGAMP